MLIEYKLIFIVKLKPQNTVKNKKQNILRKKQRILLYQIYYIFIYYWQKYKTQNSIEKYKIYTLFKYSIEYKTKAHLDNV